MLNTTVSLTGRRDLTGDRSAGSKSVTQGARQARPVCRHGPHLAEEAATARRRQHLLMFWISSSFRRISLWRAKHQSSDTVLFRFLMKRRGTSLSTFCLLLLLNHQRLWFSLANVSISFSLVPVGDVYSASSCCSVNPSESCEEGQRSGTRTSVIRLRFSNRALTW